MNCKLSSRSAPIKSKGSQRTNCRKSLISRSCFHRCKKSQRPRPLQRLLPRAQRLQHTNQPNQPRGATKEEPPVQAVPAVDQEEQKRLAKVTSLLMNSFKKRKERVVVQEDQQTRTEETVMTRPQEVPEDMWGKMLKLREERLETEEAVAALRSKIEALSAHHRNLETMERVARYSLSASQWEVTRVKEDSAARAAAAAAVAAPTAAAEATGDMLGPPLEPPKGKRPSVSPRPPSQLVKGR